MYKTKQVYCCFRLASKSKSVWSLIRPVQSGHIGLAYFYFEAFGRTDCSIQGIKLPRILPTHSECILKRFDESRKINS